jgi:hypothetical protein
MSELLYSQWNAANRTHKKIKLNEVQTTVVQSGNRPRVAPGVQVARVEAFHERPVLSEFVGIQQRHVSVI